MKRRLTVLVFLFFGLTTSLTPVSAENEKIGIAFLGDVSGPIGFWNAHGW